MVQINRVYTKVGDDGKTALVGGDRVAKSDLRIECYGTVDELNAVLGIVAHSLWQSEARDGLLPSINRIQNELFNLGAELSTPDKDRREKSPRIVEADIERLESEIDALNDELPELTSFILPGGGMVSAHLHLARTVCRRAERLVVRLGSETDIPDLSIQYLNRLSDAFFVFGRWAAMKVGEPEPLWVPSA